ncbi:hypothetical protein FH608_045005 [Nonomuraea phyllanthi]|uniref:Uncharacterized protein n=1 Tax=Nonomuraea phyllanthi TaxID=2219224 RepID=A0A5C4V929_9ACTN|nr:hypothetical protein [Nonomuraea phyllanthi]KAB8188293.1 hypothetical protein FH608_045005 [Nonomuraea phyllanthi]
MTTEQETGRGAPVRRAVPTPKPKTGTRRLGAPHQSKPRPRPDVESKLSAAERARLGLDEPRQSSGRTRTDGATRARTDAPARTDRPARPGGPARPDGPERPRPGSRPAERTRPAPGARPDQAETSSRRPVPRRRPARRQRAPFVLLVVGLLCGGLVSLLLLNTMLAKDAITDANLRDEIAVARQEKEQIEQRYQLKTQPEEIAKMAEEQGQRRDWGNVNGWTADGPANRVDSER